MIKRFLTSKAGFAIGTVAVIASVGGVATASAHRDPGHGHRPPRIGYALDQCQDGNWKNFKNPDGSPKFKNQGQCIAFFLSAGPGGGGIGGGDNDGDEMNGGIHHDSNTSVNASISQNLKSGNASGTNSASGNVSGNATTGVSVGASSQ